MRATTFAPGFRVSSLDLVILPIGVVASLGLGAITWWWGFVVGFVLAHFFLFCNLFRVSRPLELVWAVVFVALAGCTIAQDMPGWLVTALVSMAVTVLVVVVEMRKPSYHGIAWQRINPGLPTWWQTHIVEARSSG